MTLLLNLLPDSLVVWFVHLLTLAGIVGYAAASFLGQFPWIQQYSTPIKFFSIVALVVGVYFQGSLSNEREWRQRASDLEAQVKVSEAQSQTANAEIKIVYRERIKVVQDTQIVVQEKIREVEKIVDAQCEVAPEAIDILNQAAKGGRP
jgi:hypothetical protein